MQNQRGFVGIGVLVAILVGLAVLGGGAYYITHQQSVLQVDSENNLDVPQQASTKPNGSTQTATENGQNTLRVDAQGNIQIPEAIRLAGEDRNKVFILEQISLGLKQYYIDYKNYPASLQNLVDEKGRIKYYDPESIEGSFIILLTKTNQDEFFAGIAYKVSSDQQHYVLSTTLKISKDQNTFKRQESSGTMLSAEGSILGVNCSDKNVFCIREDLTSQSSNQTSGIVMVSGPISLAAGQVGTWKVSESGATRFAVIWPDGSPVSVSEGSGIPNDV